MSKYLTDKIMKKRQYEINLCIFDWIDKSANTSRSDFITHDIFFLDISSFYLFI